MRTEWFVIDRFEGDTAILQNDDGADFNVEGSIIDPASSEGSVLRVAIDDGGEPQWETALVDDDETERRRAAARARIERLRR